MAADESLGAYQFGRYLFTKEREEAHPRRYEEGDYPPQTRYTMARQPNEVEREGHGADYAPAFDAGTMDVLHHPAAEPLPVNRVVGNAAGMAAHAERQQTQRANTSYSQSFKEKHLPRDEVDFLTVEKASRLMVPTMLGLGQRAARANTGQDLQASTSLSPHSQRLVDRLKKAGMVPEEHFSIPNEMTFTPAWPMSTPGGIEGHFSTLMSRRKREGGGEEPIPATEVAAGKEEGRNRVRRMRPKRSS
jgi:hypothetical protein